MPRGGEDTGTAAMDLLSESAAASHSPASQAAALRGAERPRVSAAAVSLPCTASRPGTQLMKALRCGRHLRLCSLAASWQPLDASTLTQLCIPTLNKESYSQLTPGIPPARAPQPAFLAAAADGSLLAAAPVPCRAHALLAALEAAMAADEHPLASPLPGGATLRILPFPQNRPAHLVWHVPQPHQLCSLVFLAA